MNMYETTVIVTASPSQSPERRSVHVFFYTAPLWQASAPTRRMPSQLVANYSPSAHFHNTERGSLYCFQ